MATPNAATPNDVYTFFLDYQDYTDLTDDQLKNEFQDEYGPLEGKSLKTWKELSNIRDAEHGKKVDFSQYQADQITKMPEAYMIPEEPFADLPVDRQNKLLDASLDIYKVVEPMIITDYLYVTDQTGDMHSEKLSKILEAKLDELAKDYIDDRKDDVRSILEHRESDRKQLIKALMSMDMISEYGKRKGMTVHKNTILSDIKRFDADPELKAAFRKKYFNHFMGITLPNLSLAMDLNKRTLLPDAKKHGFLAHWLLKTGGESQLEGVELPEGYAQDANMHAGYTRIAFAKYLDSLSAEDASHWDEMWKKFDEHEIGMAKNVYESTPERHRPEVKRLLGLYNSVIEDRNADSVTFYNEIIEAQKLINDFALAKANEQKKNEIRNKWSNIHSFRVKRADDRLRLSGLKLQKIADQITRYTNIKFEGPLGTGDKLSAGKQFKKVKDIGWAEHGSMATDWAKYQLEQSMKFPNLEHKISLTPLGDVAFSESDVIEELRRWSDDQDIEYKDVPFDIREVKGARLLTREENVYKNRKRERVAYANKLIRSLQPYYNQKYGTPYSINLLLGTQFENTVSANEMTYLWSDEKLEDYNKRIKSNEDVIRKNKELQSDLQPQFGQDKIDQANRELSYLIPLKKRHEEVYRINDDWSFGDKKLQPAKPMRWSRQKIYTMEPGETIYGLLASRDAHLNDLRTSLISPPDDEHITDINTGQPFLDEDGEPVTVADHMLALEAELGKTLQMIIADRFATEGEYANARGKHPILEHTDFGNAAAYGPALHMLAQNPDFLKKFGVGLPLALRNIEEGTFVPYTEYSTLKGVSTIPLDVSSGAAYSRPIRMLKNEIPELDPLSPKEYRRDLLFYQLQRMDPRKATQIKSPDWMTATKRAIMPVTRGGTGPDWPFEFNEWQKSVTDTTARAIAGVLTEEWQQNLALGGLIALSYVSPMMRPLKVKGRPPKKLVKTMGPVAAKREWLPVAAVKVEPTRVGLPKTTVTPVKPKPMNFGAGKFFRGVKRSGWKSTFRYYSRKVRRSTAAAPKPSTGITQSVMMNPRNAARLTMTAKVAESLNEGLFINRPAAVARGLEGIDTNKMQDLVEDYVYLNQTQTFLESGDLNVNPGKFKEDMRLIVDASYEVMKHSGSVFDQQESGFDPYLTELATMDPLVDDVTSGKGKLRFMPLNMYPTYLKKKIQRSLQYRPDHPNAGQKVPWEVVGNLTLQQLTDRYLHTLTKEDIMYYAQHRLGTKQHMGANIANWIMDGAFEPVLDLHDGMMTYSSTNFGKSIIFASAVIPRVMIESVKSLNPFYKPYASWSSRITANLALGDPGLHGDLDYLAGSSTINSDGTVEKYGLEYDDPIRVFMRTVGMFADFLLPYEKSFGRIVAAPMSRAVTAYRLHRALNGGRDYTALGSIGGWSAAGAGIAWALGTDPVGMVAGASILGGLQLKGAIEGLQATTSGAAPALGALLTSAQKRKIAFRGALYDAEPTIIHKYGKVIPWVFSKSENAKVRSAFDAVADHKLTAFLTGNWSRMVDDLRHKRFRATIRQGRAGTDDIFRYLLYEETKLLIREDFWNPEAIADNAQLTGKKRKQFLKGMRDQADEIKSILYFMGIDPDDFIAKMRGSWSHDMALIATRAKEILEGEGRPSHAVARHQSYRSLVQALNQSVEMGRMTDIESSMVRAMHVSMAEILFPDNPAQFFDRIQHTVEGRGLPVNERIKSTRDLSTVVASKLKEVEEQTTTAQSRMDLADGIYDSLDETRRRKLQLSGGMHSMRETVGEIDTGNESRIPVDKYAADALEETTDFKRNDAVSKSATVRTLDLPYSTELRSVTDDVLDKSGTLPARRKKNKLDYDTTSNVVNKSRKELYSEPNIIIIKNKIENKIPAAIKRTEIKIKHHEQNLKRKGAPDPERIKEIEETIANLRTEIAKLDEQKSVHRTEKSDITNLKKEISEAKKERSRILRKIISEEKKQAKVKRDTTKEKYQKSIDDLNNKAKESDAKVKDLESRLEEPVEVAPEPKAKPTAEGSFKDGTPKQEIIDMAINDVNDAKGVYTRRLDDKKLAIKENVGEDAAALYEATAKAHMEETIRLRQQAKVRKSFEQLTEQRKGLVAEIRKNTAKLKRAQDPKLGTTPGDLSAQRKKLNVLKQELKDTKHTLALVEKLRDETEIIRLRKEHEERIVAANNKAAKVVDDVKIKPIPDLSKKQQFVARLDEGKRVPKGQTRKEAVIRYVDDNSAFIVDNVSGTWLIDLDLNELSEAQIGAMDYIWRKTVVAKTVELAARQGKSVVYIPLGEKGLYHQVYGSGEKLGVSQIIGSNWSGKAVKIKKLKEAIKKAESLKKETPRDLTPKEKTARYKMTEAEFDKQLKQNKDNLIILEADVQKLEKQKMVEADSAKIKAFDTATVKFLEDLYGPDKLADVERGASEKFKNPHLFDNTEYIEIRINDELRNILPTEGLPYSPKGKAFERLATQPLPDVPALEIPASNIEALMAARAEKDLSTVSIEEIKPRIEGEKLAREQLLSGLREGLTDDVRQFAESKIAEIDERITKLQSALLNTEEIKSEMNSMIGQFPDGTQALLYTMEDKNGKNVIFRVRPTETITGGRRFEQRQILVIEDFGYEGAPTGFNRHSPERALNLEREYLRMSDDYKRFDIEYKKIAKGKDKDKKKALLKKRNSIKQQMKAIKDEIIQYGYYDLLGQRLEFQWTVTELAKARMSSSQFANNIFSDMAGEGRRIINEFLLATVRDGYQGFAWKSTKHGHIGGALINEMRLADSGFALKSAEITGEKGAYTFVNFGTLEQPLLKHIERYDGNKTRTGMSAIAFDSFTADVMDAMELAPAKQTSESKATIGNMQKWLAVDDDIPQELLLRTGFRVDEGYIQDFHGLTVKDLSMQEARLRNAQDSNKNSIKFKMREIRTLRDKMGGKNLTEAQKAVQEKNLKRKVEILASIRTTEANIQAHLDELQQLQAKIRGVGSGRVGASRALDQHYYSNPLPNGRIVKMPVYLGQALVDEIQTMFEPQLRGEIDKLDRQISGMSQVEEGFNVLVSRREALMDELNTKVMFSDVDGVEHIMVNAIIEPATSDQIASGRKTLVINGFGLDNLFLNNELMSKKEFVLPILSKIGREAAANGFDAVAYNLNVASEHMPVALLQSFDDIAKQWNTSIDFDQVKTTRVSANKSIKTEMESFNERLYGMTAEDVELQDSPALYRKLKERLDAIEKDGKKPNPYVIVMTEPEFHPIGNDMGIKEFKSRGYIWETLRTMPITQEMRRSVPNKSKRVSFKNAKHVLYEGETPQQNVIFKVEERPMSSSDVAELVVDETKNSIYIQTPYAHYELKITDRKNSLVGRQIGTATVDFDLYDELKHAFLAHPQNPSVLLEDTPVARNLMNRYQNEDYVNLHLNHFYYMEVMETYGEILRKAGFEVEVGTPRNQFDRLTVPRPDAILDQLKFSKRTRNQPIETKADFAGSGVYKAARRTGRIEGDEKATNHRYKLATPAIGLDNGFHMLDYYAMRDGVGVDGVLWEIQERFIDVQEGKLTDTDIQKAHLASSIEGNLTLNADFAKEMPQLVKRASYHDAPIFRLSEDGEGIVLDEKVMMRMATNEEMQKLAARQDISFLSEKQIEKTRKKLQSSTGKTPTANLNEAELKLVGEYLGLDLVEPDLINKYIVDNVRFADPEDFKVIGAEELPFQGHENYNGSGLFHALGVQLDRAFEMADTYTSINEYLNSSFDTSAKKFLDTFEGQDSKGRVTDRPDLGLQKIERNFILKKLRSFKFIGDETIGSPQILDLPEDTKRKYVSEIPAESRALIDRYNEGFRIIYTPGATFDDFLYANTQLIELMMGPTSQRIATDFYESRNGRLTDRGRREFTEAFSDYMHGNQQAPISGKHQMMMAEVSAFLDRMWLMVSRDQKYPSVSQTGRPHPKMTRTEMDQWNAIFRPGTRALHAASLYWQANTTFDPVVTITSIPDEPIPMQRTPAQKLSKAAMQQPDMFRAELMRDLNSELFDPHNMKIIAREDKNFEIRPGEITEGTEISVNELFRRLYVISTLERMKNPRISPFYAGMREKNLRPLTPRTAVPEKRVASIQASAKKFTDDLLGRTNDKGEWILGTDRIVTDAIVLGTDEFLEARGFDVRKIEQGQPIEISYKDLISFLDAFDTTDLFNKEHLPAILRQKEKLLSERIVLEPDVVLTKDNIETVRKNSNYRLFPKEINGLRDQFELNPKAMVKVEAFQAKKIVSAANQMHGLPMGDVIPFEIVDWRSFHEHRHLDMDNKYYFYVDELNALNDAFIDTTAPIQSARNKRLENAPTTLLEGIWKAMSQTSRDLGDKDQVAQWKQFTKGLKEVFITEGPFEGMAPKVSERFDVARNRLQGAKDKLMENMTKFEKLKPKKQKAMIWKMLLEYSEQFTPPVRTELMPTFIGIHERLIDTGVKYDKGKSKELGNAAKPYTMADLFDESFLQNIELIFNSTMEMTAGEKSLVDNFRILKESFDERGLSKAEMNVFHENLYGLITAFTRREHQINKKADIIILAIVGKTPQQYNPFLNATRLKQLRRRAYTLFYEGRWADTFTGVNKTFTRFTSVMDWKNRTLGDLNTKNVIDYLRDRGVGYANTDDAAILLRINKIVDEVNKEPTGGRPLENFPDIGADIADPNSLLTSLNILLSRQHESARFRSLTGMTHELGGRDILVKDPSPPHGTGLNLTDPARVFAEVMISIQSESIMKNLYDDILKMTGELDRDELMATYTREYGFNPFRDADQFKKDVAEEVNDLLSFTAANAVEEGVKGEAGVAVRKRKQTRLEKLEEKLMEAEEEGAPTEALVAGLEQEQFYISRARELEDFEPDRVLMVRRMANDLIKKLGIKPMGITFADQMVEHMLPDGRVALLPQKIVNALADLDEAILGGGRQLGTVVAGDFVRTINRIDRELVEHAQSTAFRTGDKERLKRSLSLHERFTGWRATLFGSGTDLTSEQVAVLAREQRQMDRVQSGFYFTRDFERFVRAHKENGKRLGISTVFMGATVVGAASIGGWPMGLAAGMAALNMHRQLTNTLEMAGYRKKTLEDCNNALEELTRHQETRYLKKQNVGDFQQHVQDELSKILAHEKMEENRMTAAHERGLQARKKFKESKAKTDEEFTAADVEAVYIDEYYKALGRGHLKNFREHLLKLVFNFQNITATLKMMVTVGGVGTIPYFVGNCFGAMYQMMLAKESQYIPLSALGGAAIGGVAAGVTGFVGGAVGGLAAATALRGVFSRTPVGASAFHRPKQVMGLLLHRQKFLTEPTFGIANMAVPASLMGGLAGGLALGSIGGVAMGALGAGVLGGLAGHKYSKAHKILTRKPNGSYDIPPVITPDGKIYFAHDLAAMIEDYGIGNSFLKAETGSILVRDIEERYENALTKIVSWMGGKRARKMLVEIAEAQDSYFRIQMFLDLLEDGKRPKEAADLVRAVMYDYGDLTEFEKNVLRQIFLFYSFAKKNTEFLFSMMLKNPDRILGFQRLQRDLQQDAFEAVEPELMVDDWTSGRYLVPLLSLAQKHHREDGKGMPNFHGIFGIEKSNGKTTTYIPVSPQVNDYDAFKLAFHLLGASGIGSSFSNVPSKEKSMQALIGQANPILTSFIAKAFNVQSFGGGPLERQKIDSRMIAADAALARLFGVEAGGIMFSTEPDKTTPWYKIQLDRVRWDEKVPGYGDGPDMASRKSMQSLAKGALIPQGHPLTQMGYYKPRNDAEGYKYWSLTQVYGPGILGQLPVGSIISSMYFSRSGNWMADIDRGDLGKWILGSQNVSIILKKIGGKTTEDILEEAKKRDIDPRDLFAKYLNNYQPSIKLEEANALYDVYVRPPGVPPEFYWGRFLGMRQIPVYTYKQAVINQWNQLNYKQMDEWKSTP